MNKGNWHGMPRRAASKRMPPGSIQGHTKSAEHLREMKELHEI